MKIASYISLGLLALWTVISLLELWLDIMPMAIYWKFTITIALIGGGVILGALVIQEYISDKKMKKDGYID